MPHESASVAVTRTLLFSSASGVLGTLGVALGEQICDMSMWDDIQLIKLLVAGGVGNALLALPAGACYALCNPTRREDYSDGGLENKSLIWTSITGGLGSLAGARILCLIDSNAKGISATSVGMVGGLTIGVCALCIEGVYYAVTACRSGQLGFGRLAIAPAEDLEGGANPNMPLLHDIEALDANHVLVQAPLPGIAEASRLVEARLGIPVADHLTIEIDAPEDDCLIEIDLNSSPPISPIASESKHSRCSIM